MALFGTNRKKDRTRARVLRAAGMRVDRSSRAGMQALAVVAKAQDWQKEGWAYRDRIGELRYALQFLARSISRVTFFPAQIDLDSDGWIPFDSDTTTLDRRLRDAAVEHLARLPFSAGYTFTGIAIENLIVAGEVWLHGYLDPTTEDEVWRWRSVNEVEITSDGGVNLIEPGGVRRPLPPQESDNAEELIRLWVPHPAQRSVADSPMKPLRDPCEDVVLAGMELRAASRSRSATNGLLFMPNGMSLPPTSRDDQTYAGMSAEDEGFMAEFTAGLVAPISNESDPSAVVPLVLTGEADDIQAVKHVKLERATAEDLMERIEGSLRRIARGIDLPAERMTGMGAANHWTAWMIDSDTFRNHIEPWVRVFADSLLEGYLRPALIADGFPLDQVKAVVIGYDAGNLTENPNRGQDAMNAYDRGGIGRKALVEALGFSEADMPDDEELMKMIALKTGVDTAQSAVILQAMLGQAAERLPRRVIDAEPAPQIGAAPDQPKTGAPGVAPADPVPTRPEGVTAAAYDPSSLMRWFADASIDAGSRGGEWYVDEGLCDRLAAIDQQLREQILIAADAALARSLEKARNRLRSKVNGNAKLRAQFAAVAVEDYGRVLGREGALALGEDEQSLLHEALLAIQEKFETYVGRAALATARTLAQLLRIPGDDRPAFEERVRASLALRVERGWTRLRDGLFSLAERYLFDPHPEKTPPGERDGERPDGLVPAGLVRAAIADVGGPLPGSGGIGDKGVPERADALTPLNGLTNGTIAQEYVHEEGGESLGFEWRYGITAPPDQFPPHFKLDGKRFTGWDDPALRTDTKDAWLGPIYRPGDHQGCGCDYLHIWAIPTYERLATTRVGAETASMADTRRLAEADDAAGRTGTVAQRTRDERDRILALQKRYITGGN